MNREILFRGKRIDNGEWVYGDRIFHTSMKNGVEGNHVSIFIDFDTYQVEPETVGQFTGLLDKNGTKIFEGDIVRHSIDHTIYDGNKSKNRVIESKVFWSEFRASFSLQMNTHYNNDLYKYVRHEGDAEVIGNIHEGGVK